MGAVEPWQLEQFMVASTVPLTCLVASFHVEFAPLNAAITAPWQVWQAVVVAVCGLLAGGVAWQDLPQLFQVPLTTFHTGVCPMLLDWSFIVAPWQ